MSRANAREISQFYQSAPKEIKNSRQSPSVLLLIWYFQHFQCQEKSNRKLYGNLNIPLHVGKLIGKGEELLKDDQKIKYVCLTLKETCFGVIPHHYFSLHLHLRDV